MQKNRNIVFAVVATIIIIAAVVLISLPSLISWFSSSPLPYHTLQVAGGPINITGVNLLGLSNVGVFSNAYGLAGSWWLATVQLGGSQGLEYSKSFSSTQANPNQSYVSNGQQNLLTVQAKQNQLLYSLQNTGTPVDRYGIQRLQRYGNPVILNYSGCQGAFLYSYQQQYFSTGQVFNVSCATGTNQTIQNWANACSGQQGIPIPTYTSSGPTFTIYINPLFQLFNFGGVPVGWSPKDSFACEQLLAAPYSYIYGLNPAAFNQTVSVVMNGQSETVSSSVPTNMSGSSLIVTLLKPALSGQIPSSASAQVQVYPGNGTEIVIPALPLTGPGSLASVYAQIKNVTQNPANPYMKNVSTLNSFINQENAAISGSLYPVQQSSPFWGSYVSNGKVVLNDPNGKYIVPQAQLLVRTNFLGLYLGVPSLAITGLQVTNFTSGAVGTAYLTIQNNGTASGGFTATMSSNSTAVQFSPNPQQGTLTSGNKTVLVYSVALPLSYINQTLTAKATVCPTYSSQGCISEVVGFKVSKTPTRNYVYNVTNGNQIVTNPSPSNLSKYSPPATPFSCGSGAFYNSTTNGCWPFPKQNNTGAYIILGLIVGVIVVVIIGYAYITFHRRGPVIRVQAQAPPAPYRPRPRYRYSYSRRR